MGSSPFLTNIDSRAAIKGSRDPLGIQPIWTKLGRYLIGNLTTVSTSVRDFTVLILGYYFAERIAAEGGGDGDLAVFLKWEQLAGYARAEINHDRSFRGTERVKKTLNEQSRIYLSKDFSSQILFSQKAYGIWGLYTVPSRSSHIVEGDPTRLTLAGRRLVENVYIPIFKKQGFRNGDFIAHKLAPPKVPIDVKGKDRPLLKAVAKILKRRFLAKERSFYKEHLLLGRHQDRTGGLQEILAEAMKPGLCDPDWEMSPARIRHLAKTTRGFGERGERTAERLERIRTAELVLAPAAALFGFLMGSEGQTILDVANFVRKQWGQSLTTINVEDTALLEGDLCSAAGDKDAALRWLRLSCALAEGAYEEAIRLLLEQNRFVMKMRSNAAPWIDLRENKLQVRFRDERRLPLPEKNWLPQYWRHSYFIDSLRKVAKTLQV